MQCNHVNPLSLRMLWANSDFYHGDFTGYFITNQALLNFGTAALNEEQQNHHKQHTSHDPNNCNTVHV